MYSPAVVDGLLSWYVVKMSAARLRPPLPPKPKMVPVRKTCNYKNVIEIHSECRNVTPDDVSVSMKKSLSVESILAVRNNSEESLDLYEYPRFLNKCASVESVLSDNLYDKRYFHGSLTTIEDRETDYFEDHRLIRRNRRSIYDDRLNHELLISELTKGRNMPKLDRSMSLSAYDKRVHSRPSFKKVGVEENFDDSRKISLGYINVQSKDIKAERVMKPIAERNTLTER